MNPGRLGIAERFAPPGLKSGGGFSIAAPSGASDAFLALALAGSESGPANVRARPNVVLAVTPGLPDADRLADDLRFLAARPELGFAAVRILELPPRLADDRTTLGIRLKTIAALLAWSMAPYPCVIVASYPALATPVPRGTVPTLEIRAGEAKMRFSDFAAKLAEMGYSRVPTVASEGDYAVRGGLVDAWSPGEEFPVRAEFFGEELETLRTFDSATQISIERVELAEFLPVSEPVDAESLPRQNVDAESLPCQNVDAEALPRQNVDAESLRVREGLDASSSDAVRHRVYGASQSFFDLLPDGATILALDHNAYTLDSAAREGTSRTTDPRCARASRAPAVTGLARFRVIYAGDPPPAGVPAWDLRTAPLPGFAELGADEAHHPELFEAARQRLDRHLAAARARGAVILRLDGLSGGFELTATLPPGTEQETRGARHESQGTTNRPQDLIVVTKADRVFVRRKTAVRRTSAQGARLGDFDDLEPGEYVVHVEHGVGRYVGSSEILVDGKRSEVFTIEYADGAKLHVPAAHAHLLSRYVGVRGEAVRLHRLDGKRWTKDCADAQKAVADLASALLETQARREMVPGFAYDVRCEGLDAFEAAFPYEETPDQTAAIAAVKEDLARTRPMDRLICGDAGYGKTEVAMRAAYIAALNGKQVAVLAPTTVLAEQHFETFTSRFDGTPVRIESMSRFQSDLTHRGTFERLASGACDIVIGTHAILSKRTVFHDLGLIIIDEEQRFGVRHKEYLKRLRATADVLTLSATPIPRTLYLSMTGAREMSLLRSPPTARVAVDTKIVRDSDEIVRAAIRAELARGGQVFFLHNRVADIGKVEKRLKALFPPQSADAVRHRVYANDKTSLSPRIVVAHGQMDARTLARKMRDFERREYDVLLSTTIVESGIDIPNANTILVDRADTFGMADLYQLRGRVGRSSREGHAIFLLPPSGDVDSEARERLDALRRHGGLGGGFNLAVRDLELRGAGNLLGAQQSGHIAAVGFGLYCQLLKRTVALLKGETPKEIVDVKLNLDFIELSPSGGASDASAALPYDYVEEDAQRMNFMKRFAEASEVKDVKALAAELQDRFGRLPPAAARLVRLAELRVRCARRGFGNLDVLGPRAVFARAGSREVALVVTLKGKTPDRKITELIQSVSKKI